MEDNAAPDARPKRRTARLVAGLVVAGVATATLLVFWMYPAHESSRSFEVPKITNAHVDEEPFMRVELGPGQSYRPIELMAGTEIEAVCEVVSHGSKRAFALTAFGERLEGPDCTFKVRVPDEVGRSGRFVYEYRDGDARGPTDVMEVPVIVVAAGEHMEFHAVEDEKGNPIPVVSVPERVNVFARAITSALPRPSKEYAALFFVADPLNGVPVLQLAPMTEDDKGPPRPLVGNVVRYRAYGKAISGYALWTPEPIALGGADDSRRVFDVYAGIFPRAAIDRVFAATLAIEKTGPGSVSVKPLVRDLDAVRALTVGGKLLSPPLHVVRGPGNVVAPAAAGRQPPEEAPAPAPVPAALAPAPAAPTAAPGP